MNTPKKTKAYFTAFFAEAHDKERLTAAFTDVRGQLIAVRVLYEGTNDHAQVFPREIVKEALFHNATGVILTHNHPSGNTKPSRDDIAITETIQQALTAVDIRLLDHIIVARDVATSLREGGFVSFAPVPVMTLGNRLAVSSTHEDDAVLRSEEEKPSVRMQIALAKKRSARSEETAIAQSSTKAKEHEMAT